MRRFKIEIEGKTYIVEVEEIFEEEAPPTPVISEWKVRGRKQLMIKPFKVMKQKDSWKYQGRLRLMAPKSYKERGIKGYI